MDIAADNNIHMEIICGTRVASQKKTIDAGLLGHLSQEALAAAALSDLWTMTSLVWLNGGVLGVLVGGAVGAGNPKLAGETFVSFVCFLHLIFAKPMEFINLIASILS